MVTKPAGFLLDTNVISELMKRRPNRRVAEWVDVTSEELLHLSVITIGEIRRGIDLLDDDDPRRRLIPRKRSPTSHSRPNASPPSGRRQQSRIGQDGDRPSP